MPVHPPREPVTRSALARFDRRPIEKVPQVRRQGFCTGIAVGRVGCQAPLENGPQISWQVRIIRQAGRAVIRPPGRCANCQLRQRGPQRKDIGRNRDTPVMPLFGRCKGTGQGQADRGIPVRRLKAGGDTEIDQFQLAIRGDEEIGRFEITMQDKPAMGVRHAVTRGQHQPDAILQAEPLLIGMLIDRDAVNEFHNQELASVRGTPAIDEPGNIGMFQTGQCLPFSLELAMLVFRLDPGQLDRCRLVVMAVSAPGPIDLSHAATAQKLLDRPGAQPVAVLKRAGILRRPPGRDQGSSSRLPSAPDGSRPSGGPLRCPGVRSDGPSAVAAAVSGPHQPQSR